MVFWLRSWRNVCKQCLQTALINMAWRQVFIISFYRRKHHFYHMCRNIITPPGKVDWPEIVLYAKQRFAHTLHIFHIKIIAHLFYVSSVLHRQTTSDDSAICTPTFPPRGPFYKHGLTLISAWMNNHLPCKVWDEIIYPCQNFNGCTVEVSEWKSNFIPHFIMDVIIYTCWD